MTILTPIFLSLSLLGAIFLPWTAGAGVLSFFSSFFGSASAEAEEKGTPNSQNMALLQAALSPTTTASSTPSVAIVGGTSLSPETADPISDGKDYSSESDQISLYVVHQGDTLPEIAKMFGVTTNTIVWANDLTNNKITPGQKLVILPISGVKHTVKAGDTLQSITKMHKGDLAEVLQYNNLSKDAKLAVGDVIIVPDGEVTVSSASTKSSKSSGSSIGVGVKVAGVPIYEGFYLRPVIGGIKTQGIHGHNGVDLASSYGSNILASASGTVLIAKAGGWNGGYGSYVVISHSNGTQTLYGHLSGVTVSAGDEVNQGEIIGYMGSTGKSTGTHLHFEVRGARNPF